MLMMVSIVDGLIIFLILRNKDIFCYLYVIDIDKQKRQELALKNKAEHDGLTGLYNRSKAINEINQILLSNEMTCGH